MAVTTDEGMDRRFGELLGERIGRHLRRREQKESFALYAHGIVADGERKSVEPISARATGAGNDDDEEPGVLYERTQARLLNFLRDSPRDDRSVRREAARDVIGELGLDPFEGRSFPGWHHHVSVVLSCYAFIVAERLRRFSPSTRRQADDSTIPVAA